MLPSSMMDDYPLTLTRLVERAGTLFPRRPIVSRAPDGAIHRYTYGDYYQRVRQLANALKRLGVKEGDRVATLCWNHYRHFELYAAVPALGAVLHTLNLRLHPSDLTYIANHAEDSVVVVDRSLLPLLAQFRAAVPSIRHVVVIPDDGPVAAGDKDYEAILAAETDAITFPETSERSAAAMCYTSGTTGHPKGVLYSHRSTVLHSMAVCLPDCFALSESDAILSVVPMFHANAWGLPYAACLTGAKMVFPGPNLSPESLLDLMAAERVTLAGGVPTIWLGILALLDQHPGRWDLSALRMMVVGGSAAPPSMISGFQERHGITVMHAWGMTEMNPLGTVSRLKEHMVGWSPAEQLRVRASQGYAVPFVDLRHTNDEREVLPRDGATMGELEVRGPWVAGSYYRNDEQADRFTPDGWFRTGDIVTIDGEGYVSITDRSKDVIKSGGEWISTVALENALMAHPAVLEAAVFAGRHPRWDERPLAAVVCKPGQSVTAEELAAYLAPQVAKFWLPDAYLFVPEIPKTSVGKFQKLKLREQFGDYLLRAPA